MEQWIDQGIVLSARAHGEGGAVLSLLTEKHGRHNGYVHGAKSSKMRGLMEAGTILEVEWKSRVADQLGHFAFEHGKNTAAMILGDPMKLAALLSACSLCDATLPEREGHPGLFNGMKALLDTLQSEIWGAAYVLWELALLKELGFGLDLTRCVAGGDSRTLTYVSPKSGCAVSLKEGYPYKDKLLLIPDFLKPEPVKEIDEEEILKGLKMTGYFLENWVFAHHSQGVPAPRLRFASVFAKKYNPAAESAA
ncbi:MAG TPA: DNA repair protein RecO [Alphaproteobacteria bacterium]|nr:DNA repair protein RecO [Alphaproteobacteria bacterium]HNS45230.1 DNA repair protein RecO [Alphaproteobacteria bacterium]